MPRIVVWILLALLAVPAAARAQAPAEAIPPALPDLSAWIARAEPAVACVLVSRSPLYKKYGLLPRPDRPGVLGGFGRQDRARALAAAGLPFGQPGRDPPEVKALNARLDLANLNHTPEAFGSGLVIDEKGFVLTCYHVVQDAVKVFVRLPGGHGSYCDIHAADPRSDLAVLRLLEPGPRPLQAIVFGNGDELRRGQPVVALCNPYAAGFFDGQPSVSAGIVSNLRRRIPGRQPAFETSANPLYQYGLLVQTDARLPLGSSGGALLDAHGDCIAIATALGAIAGTDAPGGFAIPLNRQIRKIVNVLRRGEEVEYGYLGVGLEETHAGNGAVVSTAQRGSPAKIQADLHEGDAIVAVGQIPVRDNQDLLLGLGQYQAGDRVRLTIRRNNVLDEREVTLVKYCVQGKTIATSTGRRPVVGGMRVDYSSILVQQRGGASAAVPRGVVVTEVASGSRADRLGILHEDLITRVGNRFVNTPDEFYRELDRQGQAAVPVVLTIHRGNTDVSITW